MASNVKGPLHNSSAPRDKEPSTSTKDKEGVDKLDKEGVDKLLKWQHDRIERKLRGEYESAVLHLGEVINSNLKTPISINAVRVEGATNTRKAFLASIIDPVISPPPSSATSGLFSWFSSGSSVSPTDAPANASHSETSQHVSEHAPGHVHGHTPPIHDLESLLHATRTISSALRKTDIFSSVEAYIDRPKDPLWKGGHPGDVDLVFKTKERGRLFVSSSTELGNSEGSANATTRLRNIFGSGETFEASISMGTKTKRAFRSLLTAPLLPYTGDANTKAVLEVFGQERDLSGYASCWEGVRGVKGVLRREDEGGEGRKGWGTQEWAWEGVRRGVGGLGPTASISMREEAGTSIKSALSHTWLYDTRDDRIAATKGVYVKLFQELAGASLGDLGVGGNNGNGKDNLAGVGLGGDAKFYKVEMEGQVSRGVGLGGVSVSLAARAGLLWGLGSPHSSDDALSGQGSNKRKTTYFSDRFQLGGPTSVRGFKANGMGPRDGADSIGGQIYYSAGLSFIGDVPKKPDWPLKWHGWVNVGRLDGVDQSTPLPQTLSQTLTRPSISTGLGLIYRFDPVRVEVNFGVPVVRSESDQMRRGVQVGMGVEFM